MSSDRFHVRTKESLSVATFLGGLTLTALTLMFGLEINYHPVTFSFITPIAFYLVTISYKELLILFSGIASAFLITSVFGLKTVLVRGQSEEEFFSKFALYSYEAGYLVILFLVIPLLVLPFSILSTIVILIIEASWFAVWIADRHKRNKEEERKKNK